MENIRTPIVCMLGHVDHGKTTTLDKIRGSTVAERESGAITQHIGATEIPIDIIDNLCGPLLNKEDFKVPGLLFIDTPGHHAFTSLRSRGGSLADIAVLVVDATDGFQPQTEEALDILKRYKTPFVVALNKIDKIPGWQTTQNSPFQKSITKQKNKTQTKLEEKIYEIVGNLHEAGFQSERFDRVKDYSNTVGIIPISAKTGEGIPDLLMVLVGVAQQYFQQNLIVETQKPGKGTVLEVKEEKGLGKTIDVILYDGVINVGDQILIGSHQNPIKTKIRSLLKPKPTQEIRETGQKFQKAQKVDAASGIKIVAPNLDNVFAGYPFQVINNQNEQKIKQEMQSQVNEILIETETSGVIVKADTIGSLEAIVKDLKESNINIRKATIGDVSKRDVVEAETIEEKLDRVILAFDVNTIPEAKKHAKNKDVEIFTSKVIYRLIEKYEEWVQEIKQKREKQRLEKIIRPGKIELLPDHTFRQNNPAIVGVKVHSNIRPGYRLMKKNGQPIGELKEIQDRGEKANKAEAGKEVAVSISGPTVGRQIEEGDILYVDIPEKHAKIIEKELKDKLTEPEKQTFQEITEIKRKQNKFWAI
ncbi:Translation initiation factor 2 GTPase [Methanonatronarchaeum thermophilum]|uniref:Probable translation initiation factor IF-2 n=1 Tax=Methanonatronarchaeum thermophilum TaxID=1927129 RepID=A0A1Y3GBX6_9EURY|nr:translation initiation factor IF-2 [Methanonatronarchaeum thermophilum]OUJ18961.1 Translation initiation factor 2 GTPase [Methanonatronarchaeum thermophilum]